MTPITIAPLEWRRFVEEFSHQHHGWQVTLKEVATRQLEADPVAVEAAASPLTAAQPFQRIIAESSATGLTLTVWLGSSSQPFSHRLEQPLQILFDKADSGAHVGLRIDTADGESTLIRFRHAAIPEDLDGLAPSEYL